METMNDAMSFRFLAGIDNRTFDNIQWYDTEYDFFTYTAPSLEET